MEPPRGVPVSNPARLRDFPGFLRSLVFAFAPRRPALEASRAGAKRGRGCAVPSRRQRPLGAALRPYRKFSQGIGGTLEERRAATAPGAVSLLRVKAPPGGELDYHRRSEIPLAARTSAKTCSTAGHGGLMGVSRPVGRVLRPLLARGDGHPSGTAVADSLVRSTRGASAGQPSSARAGRLPKPTALLTLLRVGFTKPPQSPAALVVSYTTVSPLPCAHPRVRTRRSFSVALSRGSPRVDVIDHPAVWSPDLPHRAAKARRDRPADSPGMRVPPGPPGVRTRLGQRAVQPPSRTNEEPFANDICGPHKNTARSATSAGSTSP